MLSTNQDESLGENPVQLAGHSHHPVHKNFSMFMDKLFVDSNFRNSREQLRLHRETRLRGVKPRQHELLNSTSLHHENETTLIKSMIESNFTKTEKAESDKMFKLFFLKTLQNRSVKFYVIMYCLEFHHHVC
eukprot:GDKJ01022791.1.p1 GENE.GDKJ01022791.1~~GDKJ01022791.1.p1  ORF type:complete len:132 (+),score=6.51 GDKJ01022791.1:282-677(+)